MNNIPLLSMPKTVIGGLRLADTDTKTFANDVHNALKTWGFFYLCDHGIPENKLKSVYESLGRFFEQPLIQKNKLKIMTNNTNSLMGYVPTTTESLDPNTHLRDFKEALEYKPCISSQLTDLIDPKLVKLLDELYYKCADLVINLGKIIAFGIGIEPEVIVNRHMHIGDVNNLTMLRCLNYPQCQSEGGLFVRCGEHTDYGTITLLFQDDVGGLEVLGSNDEYIAVKPIPGTVVVNAADILQQWSNNRIKSAKHRVVVNDNKHSRMSIAFFCNPDNDVSVSAFGTLNDVKHTTALDYITMRCKEADRFTV